MRFLIPIGRSIRQRGLLGLLLAVVVAVFIAALLGIALVGYWTAAGVDEGAVNRQAMFVNRGLNDRWADIPVEQESVTLWDDAVSNVHDNNQSWIDENLGKWMNSYFSHDRVYILNPENDLVYALKEGVRTYDSDRPVIGPLVDLMRTRIAQAYARGESDSSSIGALGVEVFARVGPTPAIVSIKPIVSSSDAQTQRAGDEFLHVAVVFLGPGFLKKLGDQYDIRDLEFIEPHNVRASAPSVPVMAADGAPLGFLQWRVYRPGQVTIMKLVPVLAVTAAAFAFLLLWFGRYIWRSTIELRARDEQTRFLAYYDSLTGLPNRSLFDDSLEHALAALRQPHSRRIALHVIDIDRFKNVNDTLGHATGDELVRQIAGRLRSVVPPGDTIARIGGDEFAVLQLDVDKDHEASALAQAILSVFQEAFDLDGEHTVVTASIGIVVSDGPTPSKADLLRRADIALYEAKGRGRSRYQLFAHNMDAAVRRRRLIERDLRKALESGTELLVAYQPQFATDGVTLVGAEALVRWQHPSRGLLLPDAFIGIAEERGLIGQLGEWVLRQACELVRETNLPRVAVNVSPLQFHNEKFATRVLEILRETGVPPHRLELEVTEGVLIEEGPMAEAALKYLRAAGVSIALDDFGTGYSSMHYLHRYEVDKIKIDKSFVQQLMNSRESDAIIQAIVSLGRALNRRITAEGVETIEQREQLTKLGCDELQGYLLGKPMFADQLKAFLNLASSVDRRRSA